MSLSRGALPAEQSRRTVNYCQMLARHSTGYFLDLLVLCSFMLTLFSSFTSRTACAHKTRILRPRSPPRTAGRPPHIAQLELNTQPLTHVHELGSATPDCLVQDLWSGVWPLRTPLRAKTVSTLWPLTKSIATYLL